MAHSPLILFAGGEAAYLEFQATLPSSSCTTVLCTGAADVLERGARAAAVIVESNFPGGGEKLCQRLRSDPLTAKVPLILRAKDAVSSYRYVDEVVSDPTAAGLLDALARHCPTWARPPVRQAAPPRSASKPTIGPAPWSAMPPSIERSKDLLDFTKTYTRYVSGLLDGYRDLAALDDEDHARLEGISQLLLDNMDEVMSQTQRAVNEALRAGDLDRMRQLSSARSLLFEKLQRLRAIVRPHQAGDDRDDPLAPEPISRSAPPAPPARPRAPQDPSPRPSLTPAADLSDVDADAALEWTRAPHDDAAGARPATPPGAEELSPPKPQKSALSRAAEERALQRRQQEGQRAKAKPAASIRTVTVIKEQRRRVGFWIVVVVIMAVIGGVALQLSSRRAEPPPTRGTNQPPVMTYVALEETPAGILVRPQATDADGDRITFRIRWLVDGEAVERVITPRLPPNVYERGSRIEAIVTPFDLEGEGEPMQSQPLIARKQAAASPQAPATSP